MNGLKQQNLEKRQLAIRYLTIIACVGCIIYILYKFDKQDSIVYSNFYSTIPAICLFAWMIFDKWLWKTAPFYPLLQFCSKWLDNLLSTPILDGRWEGYFIRDYERSTFDLDGNNGDNCKNKHPFVLEITQTFSSITCQTFSTHSRSTADLSEILFDDRANTFCVHFHWKCTQNNTQFEKDSFEGYTTLNLVEVEQSKLVGKYFTDRDPQTKGEIVLVKVNVQKQNAFGTGVSNEARNKLGMVE